MEKNFEHDTTLPIPDEGSMEINAVKLCTDSAIRTPTIGKSNYKLILVMKTLWLLNFNLSRVQLTSRVYWGITWGWRQPTTISFQHVRSIWCKVLQVLLGWDKPKVPKIESPNYYLLLILTCHATKVQRLRSYWLFSRKNIYNMIRIFI